MKGNKELLIAMNSL